VQVLQEFRPIHVGKNSVGNAFSPTCFPGNRMATEIQLLNS
jgi:hypothetical protein